MFKDAGFRQRDIQKLGDDKLFIGPKHNIYAAFFMIPFGLLDLILLFDFQIRHWTVKETIEN